MILFCPSKYSARYLKKFNAFFINKHLTAFTIAFCLFLIISTSRIANAAASSDFVFLDIQDTIKELQLRVEKASPGVVTIIAYDITGAESGTGSGFFIDREGQIITNAAVMKDAYSAEVLSEFGRYDHVAVISYDEDLDLALIRIETSDALPLEIDFDYKIKPDEKVDIIGKTHDLKRTFSEGPVITISKIHKNLEIIKIQKNIPISSFKASMDGPLLNRDGKVIGMATTAVTRYNNPLTRVDFENKTINAVSVNSIKYFTSKPGSTHPLYPAKSKVWYKWLIKRVKETVVTVYIFLFMLGFSKLIAIAFGIIFLISLIQWMYAKQKKKWAKQ